MMELVDDVRLMELQEPTLAEIRLPLRLGLLGPNSFVLRSISESLSGPRLATQAVGSTGSSSGLAATQPVKIW